MTTQERITQLRPWVSESVNRELDAIEADVARLQAALIGTTDGLMGLHNDARRAA